jgi:energy-coupling factor transporter ATP-binding protein EcfA2
MSSATTMPSSTTALSRANPFPGLRPFEEADSEWFFGRSSEINELLKRLRRVHFVAVVGPSGCGKSSLIKAGVLPPLRDGYLDAVWSIASFRPGERPLDNLSGAIAAAIHPGSDQEFRKMADQGPRGVVNAIKSCSLPSNNKLLILVDQFEELFQFAQRREDRGREEAKAFLKLILTAVTATEVDVYVILTMRMEWLSECASYVGLAEAINEGIYLVPQMTRGQFQQGILGPIEAAGGTITTALVARLLNDLDGRTDQLPVLQHALMRLWEYRQPDKAFDIEDYEQIGTLSNCLSKHAESVYGELTEVQRRNAEILFRSITQVVKNRKVRRPRPFGELAGLPGADRAQLRSVIEAFAKQGRSFLFVTEGPWTNDSLVDIAHEALIRQWNRLTAWVEDEAEKEARISRLEEDAREWERGGRYDPSVLYSGYRLQRAQEMVGKAKISDTARKFLAASSSRSRWRQIGWYGSGAALLLAVICGLIYLAYRRVEVERTLQAERLLQTNQTLAQTSLQAQQAALQAKRDQQIQNKLGAALATAQSPAAYSAIKTAITAKRIYLQYVDAGQIPLIKAVQTMLREQGFYVPGYEKVASNQSPAGNQVRFFNGQDATDATKIGRLLAPLVTGNVATQAIANPNGVVPLGQFEIWLAEGTTSAKPLPSDLVDQQPQKPADYQ